MSFGVSIGDGILLAQLAFRTIQAAKQAGGEHDELAREVQSLYTVLDRLRTEISNPRSPINRANDDKREELESHAKGCKALLKTMESALKRYNRMGPEERRGRRWWHKIRFGGKTPEFHEIRVKLSTYTSAITMSLNMCSLESIGHIEAILQRVEASSTESGREIRDMRRSLHWVTAKMSAVREEGTGSVWTSYTNDDKTFWRTMRREMVKNGCTSSVLHTNRSLIKDYLEELGNRGVFDDEQVDDGQSSLLSEGQTEQDDNSSSADYDSDIRGMKSLDHSEPHGKPGESASLETEILTESTTPNPAATNLKASISNPSLEDVDETPDEINSDDPDINTILSPPIHSQVATFPSETVNTAVNEQGLPSCGVLLGARSKTSRQKYHFPYMEDCIDESFHTCLISSTESESFWLDPIIGVVEDEAKSGKYRSADIQKTTSSSRKAHSAASKNYRKASINPASIQQLEDHSPAADKDHLYCSCFHDQLRMRRKNPGLYKSKKGPGIEETSTSSLAGTCLSVQAEKGKRSLTEFDYLHPNALTASKDFITAEQLKIQHRADRRLSVNSGDSAQSDGSDNTEITVRTQSSSPIHIPQYSVDTHSGYGSSNIHKDETSSESSSEWGTRSNAYSLYSLFNNATRPGSIKGTPGIAPDTAHNMTKRNQAYCSSEGINLKIFEPFDMSVPLGSRYSRLAGRQKTHSDRCTSDMCTLYARFESSDAEASGIHDSEGSEEISTDDHNRNGFSTSDCDESSACDDPMASHRGDPVYERFSQSTANNFTQWRPEQLRWIFYHQYRDFKKYKRLRESFEVLPTAIRNSYILNRPIPSKKPTIRAYETRNPAATLKDLKHWQIPASYYHSLWHPRRVPLYLDGNVIDGISFAIWIEGWAVAQYRHNSHQTKTVQKFGKIVRNLGQALSDINNASYAEKKDLPRNLYDEGSEILWKQLEDVLGCIMTDARTYSPWSSRNSKLEAKFLFHLWLNLAIQPGTLLIDPAHSSELFDFQQNSQDWLRRVGLHPAFDSLWDTFTPNIQTEVDTGVKKPLYDRPIYHEVSY
ncbi:hypothetical protein GLAREA_06190 [Glarea lozoyensis ATCC 20868]|uniref:Azaphilone pigments biosynthesis cluster protein L N-terminal domain-containing protein n=1 Tax=Glarea lozoyensis (strain ATCC 20868 / MF5171) TaxID=1116229 RepID=S3E406_GLAL2|nr:uncharacterized protein GLAREA_06190 [Glarea lozoyensis ATCC 20868]EPE33178.1 hypothetical protein GLAREA_06190 [Glarea lozoyensis ATCC 20868]